MAGDRIRELLAIDLVEQPESFDPTWISRHLDVDRIRQSLLGDMVAMVRAEHGDFSHQAAMTEAQAQLDELMEDPQELIAVLGEELGQYLHIEEAADDAAEHNVIPVPIKDQLQEIMAQLDELGMCDKCHEIPVEAGEKYCDSCKRDLGVNDGY